MLLDLGPRGPCALAALGACVGPFQIKPPVEWHGQYVDFDAVPAIVVEDDPDPPVDGFVAVAAAPLAVD